MIKCIVDSQELQRKNKRKERGKERSKESTYLTNQLNLRPKVEHSYLYEVLSPNEAIVVQFHVKKWTSHCH